MLVNIELLCVCVCVTVPYLTLEHYHSYYADFGPISLTKGSHVEFDLDYNYFFNTQLFSTNTQNISISIISATESTVGVLFYSKTDDSIQRLEVIII